LIIIGIVQLSIIQPFQQMIM